MANFGNVIEWVLRLEDRTLAGKTESLGDGAGWTRFGLTSRDEGDVLPVSYFVDGVTAKRMSNDQALEAAKQVYYDKYWTPIQGTTIADDEVAAEIMSSAVNMGVKPAIKLLQHILAVEDDGTLGQETLRALAGDAKVVGYASIAESLREAQEARYEAMYEANPTRDAKFIKGWENRARAHYPDLP